MTSSVVKCKKAVARKALPIKELEKVWISTAEACVYLDCTRDFLEGLRDNAEVEWAKVSGKCYYNLPSIDRMFDRNRVLTKIQ